MTFKIGDVEVTIEGGVARWVSGMAIDVDGAPNAYAPIASGLRGLDHLANAGSPGKWWGLACAPSGEPYVQRPTDLAPGFYVSTTALQDTDYHPRDPRRYVDAIKVPYIAVPKVLLQQGVRKGDICMVECGALRCGAIVADVGPAGKIGEGSPALATALGIPSSPRNGGCSSGVLYRVFIGSFSFPAWPRQDIQAAADALALKHANA